MLRIKVGYKVDGFLKKHFFLRAPAWDLHQPGAVLFFYSWIPGILGSTDRDFSSSSSVGMWSVMAPSM